MNEETTMLILLANVAKQMDEHLAVYRKNMWSYDEIAGALYHANKPAIDKLEEKETFSAYYAGYLRALRCIEKGKTKDIDKNIEKGYKKWKAIQEK